MADVTMSIDVECQGCGETLGTEVFNDTIHVEPCPKCLAAATRDGYDEGQTDGHDEGYSEGYNACRSREREGA
jgi:hypothetical protein